MDELDDTLEPQAMRPRKKQVKKPQELPADFKKNIAKLFNDQFKTEKGEANFAIYGGLYQEEALLCVALSEVGRLSAISLYCSVDLGKDVMKKPQQVTDMLKSMVDLCASWFGQTFSEHKGQGLEGVLDAAAEMDPGWQKVAWEKRTIYVKLTKDNQTLEAAADRFLKEGK